jgi:hypothetical protein
MVLDTFRAVSKSRMKPGFRVRVQTTLQCENVCSTVEERPFKGRENESNN